MINMNNKVKKISIIGIFLIINLLVINSAVYAVYDQLIDPDFAHNETIKYDFFGKDKNEEFKGSYKINYQVKDNKYLVKTDLRYEGSKSVNKSEALLDKLDLKPLESSFIWQGTGASYESYAKWNYGKNKIERKIIHKEKEKEKIKEYELDMYDLYVTDAMILPVIPFYPFESEKKMSISMPWVRVDIEVDDEEKLKIKDKEIDCYKVYAQPYFTFFFFSWAIGDRKSTFWVSKGDKPRIMKVETSFYGPQMSFVIKE